MENRAAGRQRLVEIHSALVAGVRDYFVACRRVAREALVVGGIASFGATSTTFVGLLYYSLLFVPERHQCRVGWRFRCSLDLR